jgi:hypothetical protein
MRDQPARIANDRAPGETGTVRTTPALLVTIVVGVAVALGTTIPLARSDQRPSTIDVSEIKEGMKGYGLTVFKGTQPERFDVEVIGLLHHFRPGQELIIVRTPHPRLNQVRTVKGMSGSPIYLEGRLAGAYSYSLASFELEPVAGVTPIDLMLKEMRRPTPPGFWPTERGAPLPHAALERAPTESPSPTWLNRYEGPPGAYDLADHARQVAARLGRTSTDERGAWRPPSSSAFDEGGGSRPPSSSPEATRVMTPAATPLMLAGVADRAAAALRTLFEPLGLEPMQTGGGETPPDHDTPSHFVAGGGLGVSLVRGDVSMMGLGTATTTDGAGKVAGFGHPMLNGGDSALPTCIGRVLWIEASAAASHKIGECARRLGTLVQDRQSAVVIDETVTAPTVTLDVDVVGAVGAPKTRWHTEITEDKFLTPSLASAVLESVVEATTSERRDVTWRLTSKLTVPGHGEVALEDVGVASGGTPDAGEWARSKVVTALGDVLNNPWERARVTHVSARLEVAYARELWRLRGADVIDPVVDAGSKARVLLHLVAEHGPETTRIVEVTMPAELAGKEVEVEIAPGYGVAPEMAPPETLDELLANEPGQTYPPRSIVLQYRVPSQGIAYRGHVTDRLPPFALDALRPQNSDTGPESFQSLSRTVVALEQYVEGRDKVKIRVRSVLR